MWSVVAREVNFGMTVAYMISAEQSVKIATVASLAIHGHVPLGYLLEHTLLFTFYSTELVARLVHHLVGAGKVLELNSTMRART